MASSERRSTYTTRLTFAAGRASTEAEFEGRHRNSEVLFASKAFPCTAAFRLFAEEGLSCDVASRGELFLALQGGVDPARIYLHGNAKDDADIGAALDAGVGCVVVDSFDDIDRLERLVGERQRVFLRVNPEVEADTHEAVLTGHSGSKFGLRRDAARRAIERLRGSDKLELTGLHVHVGSQLLALEPFARALDSLARPRGVRRVRPRRRARHPVPVRRLRTVGGRLRRDAHPCGPVPAR